MNDPGVFELRMEHSAPLRLALFTDLHFNGFAPCSAALTMHLLRKNVRKLKPGLVAVLGDTAIKPDNRARTRVFVRCMDSLGIPWTAVLGNHEGEHGLDLPRREVIEYYKASPRFLGSVELPGVAGYGNQAIAVLDEHGNAAQLLYFLDSGGGRNQHSYAQPDQLDWMSRVSAQYPNTPGMIFLHVPARQYQAAYDAYRRGEAELLHGARHEKICPAGTEEQSEALLARAKELGVWALVCGHDHYNNFDILWQGMRYIYAQSGGYALRVYGVPLWRIRGCTTLDIH
ncbi:MAG: metallophosphoesterase, partial [Firmicutes bacterium]|nr:metallophosphoesterase [Bacillota bacterium]